MPNTPISSEHPHDSTLSPCMLTDWTFTCYHTPGKSEYAVVYGTVVQDGSGRLPQAAESAPRPLPYGRHRWLIRTTRYIACRKVQVAFATCLQPCSLPSTVWVSTLPKRPLSCKTPSCSLHIPCLKPPVSAFR